MITIADVKWIKITTDVFDDEKFAIIDGMPEADAIELIWFKLLVFAGKTNNGGLFLLNNNLAYTDEMLSSIFHRPLNIVRLAMGTFINLKMIEEIEGVYSIPNWSKHQSLNAYENKKERDREYQRKRREEARSKLEEIKSSDNRLTVGRDCSYSISISDSLSNIYKEVIDYLNNILNSNYRYKSTKTQGLIKARVNEGFTIDDFKKVIDIKVAEWKDTDMEKYLRPETLFGTKFESYLNQKGGKNESGVGRHTKSDEEYDRRQREIEEYLASDEFLNFTEDDE